MTFALALLLASLDGGRHGDAFALHGVGVPVWEQYRRFSGPPSDYPPVHLVVDGGALRFFEVRQGCNSDGGCFFAAPGVFISRVPGSTSPAFSPVWLSDVQPSDRIFDVRFALLEAAPDGGLQPFVVGAGGDNGALMDPYFPPHVDGLIVHVTIQADGSMRAGEFVNATCATASSGLREELRTNRLIEASAPTVAIPIGASFTWGLVDAGAGALAFAVRANQSELWRWTLPATRFQVCGNSDDGGYQGGELSIVRLVPVLYVGWGTFVAPQQSATQIMGFGGHGPQFGAVPTTSLVGQRLQIPVRLVDGDGNLALGASTRVEVSAFGAQVFPTSSVRPGVAPTGEVTVEFTPTAPQELLVRLELDNSFVAVERVITILPASDAGVDAGAVDAGVVDAGVADAGVVDAGVADAGVVDAGVADAGDVDAGVLDAGLVDAGDVDAGVLDAGLADAGTVDAGVLDALADAGVVFDAGSPDPDGDTPDRVDLRVGCGCSETNASMMLAALLALVVRRRR